MKKKSLICIAFGIMLAIGYILIPNESNATAPATPVNFGMSLIRDGSATNTQNGTNAGKNIGYAIGNPKSNTSESERYGAIIWNIMKYQDTNVETTGEEGDFYCLREGVGFIGASATSTNPKIESYNNSYDYTLNKDQMKSIGNLEKLVNSDNYYGILALSDLMYIDGTNVDQYLTNSGIDISNYDTKLTVTDIKAIQQAAIWYFSNNDQEVEFNNIYNNLDKDSWLFYTTDGSEYNSLSDYDFEATVLGNIGSGIDREEQANILYRYLLNTAKTKANEYKNGTIQAKSKITIYTNMANESNTQPILYLERTPEIKEFDLALSKYITKINNQELSGVNSRVPDIDETTIDTEKTATYKHKKDPVIVKTGDKITYKLTIYNEGDKAGRATKVVDQLPTGLTYSKVNTEGFSASYDETTNKITITRNSSNNTNLEAYTTGSLKSETIEIECNVTAKADSSNDKILTNVAWIAEAYDDVDKITITNTVGKDRDSEPSTIPNVNKDNMSNYTGNSSNKSDLADSRYYYRGQQDDDDFEKIVIKPAAFDLKLIKRVVEVNKNKVPERLQSVDITSLVNGTATTATYNMDKNPVSVKKGDIVKYTLRVYNEGDIDGYASEISEDIPEGLEVLLTNSLEESANLTAEEIEARNYNDGIWDIEKINTTTGRIELIKTNSLAKGKGQEEGDTGSNLIKALDHSKEFTDKINDKNPDYKEVSVYLKVVSDSATGTVIRNEAAVTEDSDKDGNDVTDRDSNPKNWVKYEDDEDYDNVKLQSFDLALRKFIIAVSDDQTIEDTEYLKKSDGTYQRAPIVDTSKLNTLGEDGKLITTAIYNHSKDSVTVNKGNYVIYNLRVFNEGDIDGYASEIKDHLPEYLEYVDCEYNKNYKWTVSEDGRTVTTTYLDSYKIEKANEEESKLLLSYKDVPIMCKVKDTAKASESITNIADITVSKDENKNVVLDRDSVDNNVVIPNDEKLPEYQNDKTGDYIPGQEDDDDFEKVIIKSFDLALRKFITEVNEKAITSRVPEVNYDSENKKITYNHSKEPVDVATDDIVTYTIRVFNEGDLNGYASKISDDIPDGLQYIPDNELNKQYRWIMYDKDGKETQNMANATKITTDYLSKEQGQERIKDSTETNQNPVLLLAFDKTKEISDNNPSYADVKVSFKVMEPNTSDRIIINSAQITDDTDQDGKKIDDIDSTPDKWIDGEDDQDQEKIKVAIFDLALRKWVTQAIVTENGKETVTQTGHTPEQDPEPVVKVELNRKNLNNVTVKFKYSIRVTNEGDIAGYAKEITDYIPEGLKFDNKDNPDWKDEGNNVISTRLLESTLLQPGESKDVEVTLTWINGKDNMGLKTNIAEISEDFNDKGIHDIDSTPDNKIPEEDDQDDAPVLLSIKTGQVKIYFILGFINLTTIASGIILIKKFVM